MVVQLSLRSNVVRKAETGMELPGSIRIQEIRGYDKSFNSVVQICAAAGLQDMERNAHILTHALGVSKRQPLDYGEKFHIDLENDISIGAAVSKICLNLVDTMEKNFPGVQADIDSEFLHDFRIAIRRTRSLLTLLKKVLPVEKTVWFQSEFKWLGNVTGPVRDIDVYLLEQETYRRLLPESLRDGLDVFFEELAGQRVRELELLRQHLSSPRYVNLVGEWRSFNSEPGSEIFSGGREQPCRPLVMAIIRKRFKSLMRDGGRITDSSPDVQLHQLRIKGKKFRYLLEFFRSFHNADDIDLLLKYMKKLQDNLGDFNDLAVQQEMLGLQLAQLKGRNKRTIRLGAALGGLIAMLAARHGKVRAKFRKTYGDFNTEKNKNLLTGMLEGNSRSSRNRGQL